MPRRRASVFVRNQKSNAVMVKHPALRANGPASAVPRYHNPGNEARLRGEKMAQNKSVYSRLVRVVASCEVRARRQVLQTLDVYPPDYVLQEKNLHQPDRPALRPNIIRRITQLPAQQKMERNRGRGNPRQHEAEGGDDFPDSAPLRPPVVRAFKNHLGTIASGLPRGRLIISNSPVPDGSQLRHPAPSGIQYRGMQRQ